MSMGESRSNTPARPLSFDMNADAPVSTQTEQHTDHAATHDTADNATTHRTAFIIVDVQNDFVTGSLAVPNGADVIPVINSIRKHHTFDLTVLSKDWHPHNHISFVSQHPGKNVFEQVKLPDGETQVCWPAHCVNNTYGSQLHNDLHEYGGDVIVHKGMHRDIDSYSAFHDNDHKTATTLHATLQQHHIDTVIIGGLALDYCVSWTAIDALKLGYKTYVVLDATRGIAEDTVNQAISDIKANGGHVIDSRDVKSVMQQHQSSVSASKSVHLSNFEQPTIDNTVG